MSSKVAQAAESRTSISAWSLFRQPEYQPQPFPILDFLFTFFFALSCVAVASVFSAIQWHSRPLTLHTITISNHSLINSLPSGYICDCSLPPYLQGLQSVQNLNTSQPARCYRKEVLQTVTVLQFSNNTVPYLPDVLPTFFNSTAPSFTTFHNGFNVTQRPFELDLWGGDPEHILYSRIVTSPLLEGNGILELSLDQVVNALYFDFPRGYMRMEFRYWCTNCTYCAYDKILDLADFQKIDVKSWAYCEGWGSQGENCQHNDPGGYEGRCLIYPTYDVPMAARLKKFLKTFMSMPNLTFMTGTSTLLNGFVDLYLFLLYVNVSQFTANLPVSYGFLEVEKLSSAWLKLSEQFPGIGNECRENATIEICNGTSFCNAFKTGTDLGSSSISLSCTDFRDDFNACMRLANTSGNHYWSQLLCPRNFMCLDVPQQSVVYNLEGENPDNRFMAGRMNRTFNETYVGAVCSNTYENIVRNGSELWATECSNTGLCHLTGKYNSANDPSWEEPKVSPRLLDYTTPLYICYAARKQKMLPWGINTAGVMFGWLSSLLLGLRCLHVVVVFVAQRMTGGNDAPIEENAASNIEEVHEGHVELVPSVEALEERPLFPREKYLSSTATVP